MIMKYVQAIAATHIAMLVANSSALACLVPKPLHSSDFVTAEVIIVGRVINYEAVVDPVATEKTRQVLEASPSMRAHAKDYKWISYGKLDVEVDEVLKGTVPARPAIYWLPGTIGPADALAPGRYILGLGKVDTLPMHYENRPLPPDALRVEEKACAGTFIAPYASEMASKVEQLLNTHSQP